MGSAELLDTLKEGIRSGQIVPYLGADTLSGVTDKASGAPIPADSDSLILAMNDGKPMAPRLMYEFPRAAMNLENKKGRKFIERFLNTTYGEKQWTSSAFHQWIAGMNLPYVIDINRDTQLQDFYSDRPHTLIVGVARIAGTDFRFRIYQYYSGEYREITQQNVDTSLPVLFKPVGSPKPEANYIASDADYVDYITELMGGFAIPGFLKEYRKGKQYLFCGLRMLRDTERMVLSDIIYAAGSPAGWVLLPDPTDKEIRYCKKKNLTIVDASWQDLMEESLAAEAV
ncbi:MAG: SIR2 family protein [Oceanospirillaceae bacterium]|uniref:SIR2 family protein n=1 Tax=unclassified Thalassolituus TaxID=2624967 RepID=UPI000C3CC46E|nr:MULTISPECIES: SIR2 family protein [unclassified Thalassolituus]MBL34052.1 SIR2 family protein [Oceanospirillaceae bacterium]MBS52057.1 SIR2 family protein [Oceanospirillaceae bacterium]|tara:strand:- start:7178 stop:8032 length:855 start_codon:yes stop_codon:yes gene_type:complete